MVDRARQEIEHGTDDLVVVVRNELPRVLVGMRGRYTLEGWRDAAGNPRQFECEILRISPHLIKLAGPVTGAVGKWLVASFEHLGKFEGPIVQVQQGALTMKIIGTNDERAKVASKLAWITDSKKPEGRRFPRIVPVNPDSTVSMLGNVTLPCEVIDYSAGGVAVYAEICPAIGAVVKIGAIPGRVVRQFGGGFAICFLTVQNPQLMEAILRPASQGEAE